MAAALGPGFAAAAEPGGERCLAALLALLPGRAVPETCELTRPAGTLAEDLAFYLARMGDGANRVLAEARAPPAGPVQCTVRLNHDAGEVVWTRLYRFELAAGAALADSLFCATIP